MPTLDREPCSLMPPVKGKRWAYRNNDGAMCTVPAHSAKPSRPALLIDGLDFSVWLTDAALVDARPTMNRHSLECAKRERERTFRK